MLLAEREMNGGEEHLPEAVDCFVVPPKAGLLAMTYYLMRLY
jgi:hypothetical protein